MPPTKAISIDTAVPSESSVGGELASVYIIYALEYPLSPEAVSLGHSPVKRFVKVHPLYGEAISDSDPDCFVIFQGICQT